MLRLAAILGTALVLFAGGARAEPQPHPSVAVSANVIRLGDIFSDAGAHADEIVAPAPAPGYRVTYDAGWLAAAAHAHHLSWAPQSSYDQVTVERVALAIGSDAIAARLMAELAARQSVENAELRLDNPALRLIVPAERGDVMAVDGLTVDPRSGRLSAYVSAPPGDPDAVREHVTGRVVYRIDLPVLNRPMTPGETIAAQDVGHVLLLRDQIGADAVTDTAALIGKTPRHPLRADQPVRSGDVQTPIVVHRDDIVTILLETPTMRLTAQGKALEDGAMKAVIRVANSASNRVIDATVAAPNTVVVALPPDDLPVRTAAIRQETP
jgi:flagellar basal body P-ring formation protein FlgA